MKKITLVLVLAAGMIMSPLGNAYGLVYNGWENSNGYWYYYKNGSMCTGWVKESGTWYYLNSNGAMATGWKKVDGSWYYLNSNGSMKTGWVKDGGAWYYLNSSGAMATGWIKDSGVWYYLNSNGSMKTGWLCDNGKWYFLEENGALASNTTVDGYFDLSNDNIAVMNTDKQFYYDDHNKMQLIITNNSDEELTYGKEYKIEKLVGGPKWEEVPLKNDTFTEEAILIKPNEKSVQTIDLGNIDEEKIMGDYRITKEINGEKYYVTFAYGYEPSVDK